MLDTTHRRNKLHRIDFTQRYGIKTYFKNWKYPINGAPLTEILAEVNKVKKVIKTYLATLQSLPKWRAVLLLLLLFRKKTIYAFLNNFLDFCIISFRPSQILPHQFCASVREFRRVCHMYIGATMEDDLKKIWEKVVYVISMILEYDTAYRLRFQDLLPLWNKANKNLRQEINKILKTHAERDQEASVVGELQAVLKVLKLAMFLPKVKAGVQFFIDNINMEEIKFDLHDKYHACTKPDYNYFGATIDERREILKTL